MHARYALALGLLALPLPARALECFVPASNPSSLAVNAARATTLPVTLATTFRTVAGCEYGLAPDPRQLTDVPPAETDFTTLAELLRAPAGARPRTIYGRPRSPGALTESVFREGCTDTLLDDQSFFDARVDTSTREIVVSRITPPPTVTAPFARPAPPPPDCGASRTVLRFIPLDSERSSPPAVARVPAPFTLPVSARRIVINVAPPGGFAVYAARSTATDDTPGLLVGRVQHFDPYTALRRAFTTATSPSPWLRPTWNSRGEFVFARDRVLRDRDLWNELVTASDGDALWLAETPENTPPGESPRVLGHVPVAASGDGLVLPEGYVQRAMSDRYGREGSALVPTLDEWDALRRRLQVCVVDRYASAHAPPPERLPSSASCVRLARVAATVSTLPAQATTAPPREVCIHRNTWDLTATGILRTGALEDACIPLPSMPSPVAAAPLTRLVVTVGDRIALRGADEYNLFACVDNQCRVLHEGPPERGARLWRAGFVEVRRAPSLEAATSAEGVTLARFVVIDPARDWHPVGLYAGRTIPDAPTRDVPASDDTPDTRRPEDRGGAWRTLDHDEPEVFAYIRRRHAMHFRVSVPAAASAVWNSPDAPTALTNALPIVGGLRGTIPSPADPALVVLLTRDGRCPGVHASNTLSQAPLDPDALLIDQTFYAHLARARTADAPFECLARAAFRVRQRRTVSPIPRVQMGLLGDTWMTWFYADPMALGAALPVVYAHARLPYGFGVDVALDLTASVTFDSADISRAGAGVALAAVWGPLRYAPRVIALGLMIHIATETAPQSPVVSPYVGLNLATLLDLAGGR
jgi:hypothetical protein